jgi:molecular chaperone GrpE|tara:strand:+ start:560 stop:1039 length:480 start_codon:yes stop_codon:yes gene_type:complete
MEKEAKKEKKQKKSDKEIIAELTDSLQRLQAEFENHKKREEKDKKEFVKYSRAGLILEILPSLDSFEMALKSAKDNEEFVKGMEMVYAQLYSILENEGLRPILAVGQKLDPYKHEVLMREKSDKEEDMVLEELQRGYMLGDKVLRHSKVKISEKKKDAK